MEKRCCRMQMRLTFDGVGMIKALAARYGVDRSAAVMMAVREVWARGKPAVALERPGRQIVKKGNAGGSRGCIGRRKGGKA